MNMKTVGVALMGMVAFAGGAWAGNGSDIDSKAIVVDGGSGNGFASQGFRVDIKGTKSSFAVDEPITFAVQSSRQAYIYLYSVSPENRVIQLFPNQHETNNLIRPDQKVLFPQKAKFKGDRPGMEKLILIASASRITVPSRALGEEYFEIDRQEMEGLRKAIVLEGSAPGSTVSDKADRDRVVKEFEVSIVGSMSGAEIGFMGDNESAPNSRPMILVTTDKYRYRLDEPVSFGYAADSEGYVKIFQVSPKGKKTLVTERGVEKDRVYRWNGRAAAPTGNYSLVAVFSKTKADDWNDVDPFFKSITGDQEYAKGLVPMNAPDFYTVHRFVIE
jgi:Domain of unknown function (DUF4384)